MGSAPEKHVAILLVFLAGLCGAVYGFFQLVLSHDYDFAAPQAAGGLALIAWVLFHPARVPESASLEP
jgi:hypothetical protein